MTYRAFVDPAGGTIGGDSFALAIAHLDNEIAVLDLLFERPGPFSPPAVVAEIVAILREYGIGSVTGDRYSAAWVRDAFATPHGIQYFVSSRDRSAIYSEFLPIATSGRARLLDSAKLISQLSSLERIAGAGRDRIDHPRGQNDDLANVTCGALVLAAEKPVGSEGIIVEPYIAAGAPFDRWAPNWHGAAPGPQIGGIGDYVKDYETGSLQWATRMMRARGDFK